MYHGRSQAVHFFLIFAQHEGVLTELAIPRVKGQT
jgi:hypothetical protein